MHRQTNCSLALLALAVSAVLTGGCGSTGRMQAVATARDQLASAQEILARYAQAWRGQGEMRLREETILAFWVRGAGGGQFHIVLPQEGPGRLHKGVPETYTLGFETDMETLRRLDRGECNALTAMAQARGDDPIPLTPKFPAGFQLTAENRGYVLSLWFHFWNREWPEIVRFGEGLTRQAHGANAVVLLYDKGLRTAWYQVKPGMHINADPKDQVNEFPTLIIVTRGELAARLDGIERILREGEAVLVPAGMTHELWAGAERYGEFVIVMFGEGA